MLADDFVVKLLLPFCKSDYFGIRIAAKSLLSSVCSSVPPHQRRFLELIDVECIALVDALKDFSTAGSYRKMFRTSLCCYLFSAVDLLLLVSALAGNPLNVAILHSCNIYSVVSPFLKNGSSRDKDVVFELFWKLCRGKHFQVSAFKLFSQLHDQLPVEVFDGNHILRCGDPESLETSGNYKHMYTAL